LVPGWVESYVGPPALARGVDAGEDITANELRKSVEALSQRVSAEVKERERRAWLLVQLGAISTALFWFEGERLGYEELFLACHGAEVELVPERCFEEAHSLLDQALPGHGDVAVRYRAWRDGTLVPRERLGQALELLADQARRRSRDLFELPAGEAVTWELVSGKRYAGRADYLGQRHTRIRINVDLPISSHRLLELVCHEAYPGHHAEHVCKDASLIEAAGREEVAVYVEPTPQALISEGLACHALHALLGDGAEAFAADCLKSLGIPYDTHTASVVRKAEELLLGVRSNIALMLDHGTTSEQAREYARAWLLDAPEQIYEAITDLETRSWRPYESCYPVGLTICRQYADAAPERFRELLHRQLTPAELASRTR
jgi:hypothetical protein